MNAHPQQQKRTSVAPMQFRNKERADGMWQWRLFDGTGKLLALREDVSGQGCGP
jgi:hypothetical protein